MFKKLFIILSFLLIPAMAYSFGFSDIKGWFQTVKVIKIEVPVIQEVPVEVIKEVCSDNSVEVKTVYVEKPVIQEKIVEKVIEVPVEKIVYTSSAPSLDKQVLLNEIADLKHQVEVLQGKLNNTPTLTYIDRPCPACNTCPVCPICYNGIVEEPQPAKPATSLNFNGKKIIPQGEPFVVYSVSLLTCNEQVPSTWYYLYPVGATDNSEAYSSQCYMNQLRFNNGALVGKDYEIRSSWESFSPLVITGIKAIGQTTGLKVGY